MRRWAWLPAALLLAGCGGAKTTSGASKRAASAGVPTGCPPGQALVAGHFHGQYCVPRRDARLAYECSEAQYELNGAVQTIFRNPQPAALHTMYIEAAKESLAILGRAATAVAALRGRRALENLGWLTRHQAWLLSYEKRVERAPNVRREPLTRWLDPLLAHDLACVHVVSVR
jgi:hypothetical protein